MAAKFDHASSRNIDPQLHSHLFVLNVAQPPDARWRANEPEGFTRMKSLGSCTGLAEAVVTVSGKLES